MIAVPAAGDVERAPPDEHGSGLHELVEDLPRSGPTGSIARGAAAAVAEPAVQDLAAGAEALAGAVVGARR